MDQNWLSVAGIAIDLAGFLLLLREWWLAFFHEWTLIETDKQRAWERSLRQHHQSHAPEALRGHLDRAARMQDDMAEREARGRHMATLSTRKRAFVLATVLIIAGSLLQLAGQVPPELLSKLVP